LFYRHLDQDAEWIIKAAKKESAPVLPSGIKLYIVNDTPPPDFPEYLKDLKKDHAEIILDNEAYHVVIREEGAIRYYLVQDQSQFESLEQSIGITIIIGFIIALAGSIWLGYATANRIIAPVIELSSWVKNIDLADTELKDIARDYSNDEVGLLANAFSQYAQKLQVFLEREKLFTGDVSHELRTPLMVISSSCELLLAEESHDDKRHEIITRIHRSSKIMRSLVDTFLTLSRENKNPSANFSAFKAKQIVQEEIDDLKNISGANKLKPSLIADCDLIVEGVPQMFRVVIRNLLRNALHHTQQGSILVKIYPDSIHVEDSGSGIPEEFKNSIFKRHYRVASLENKSQGEGIGLSIVKRICDFHGWQIGVEAVQPHGSRFIITFAPSEK